MQNMELINLLGYKEERFVLTDQITTVDLLEVRIIKIKLILKNRNVQEEQEVTNLQEK